QHVSALLRLCWCSNGGCFSFLGELRGGRTASLGASSRRTGRTRTTTARTVSPLRTVAPLATARPARLWLSLTARHGVTLVNPNLHTDRAERRTRLEEAVLDVGPQRVQWNPALAVELGPAHFGTAEAARHLDPDPAHERVLHSRLHRLTHRATERHTATELL